MAGPWEKYQAKPASAPGGPWQRYQAPPAPTSMLPEPQASDVMTGRLDVPVPFMDEGVSIPLPAPVEASLLGAGRTINRLTRGARELGARTMRNEAQMAQLAREEEAERETFAPVVREHPVAATAGAIGPYLGPAALGGAGAGLLGAVAAPTAMSALEYQKEPEERLRAGLTSGIGGMAGYGVGRALARGLGGRVSQLDDAAETMARRGEELGFRLTPAQRTGSPTAAKVEASLEAMPVSAGPFANIKAGNQITLNKIVAKALGLGDDVKRITADKLGQAADDIGRQYDKALRGQTITLDDTFINKLARIEADYSSAWGKSNQLQGVIDDALAEAAQKGGQITGKRYQQLARMLREQARTAMSGEKADRLLGEAIGGIKDALDDAAAKGLKGDALESFLDANAKWRTMRMLDQALDPSTGNVSGRILANTLNRKDVSGFRRGGVESDLYDAARFAKMFGSQIGDSGTATRLSIPETMKMMGIGGGGGVAAGYASDYVDPETGAIIGLLSPLALRGAAGAYTSRLAQRGLLPMGQGAQRALAGVPAASVAGAMGMRYR